MRNSQNLELLRTAAEVLKPLLERVVFVGGCATAVLIDDPGAADTRVTQDVDVLVEVSYGEYVVGFAEELRWLGFSEDSGEGAPLCRWRRGPLILDAMPVDSSVLGFSNRWYAGAMKTATFVGLTNDLSIRAINGPYFLATKMEAFLGRGKGDYQLSHDLEDLVSVVDGRETLIAETESSPAEIRHYLGAEFDKLLEARAFRDALPGFLPPDTASQARHPGLLGKLRKLASLR